MRVAYIVEQTLANKPDTRDSDKLLLLDVWYKLGFGFSETQRKRFMDMPSAETITRIRRKLQEKGKYPAANNIKKTRQLKSMVVQQNMPKASVNTAERVLEEVPHAVQVELEM